MAKFEDAVAKVLDAEGGYQNDPADWGNYNAYTTDGQFVAYAERKGRTLRAGTNRGINAGLLSGLKKQEISVAEMQALSQAQAISIYKQVYWDSIQGDLIRHQALAEMIFDAKVNHGSTGVKLLQRVLNKLGYKLQVDGKLGPSTLIAVNQANPITVHDAMIQARRELYHHLAERREGNQRFLKGWLARLDKFPPLGSGSPNLPSSPSSRTGTAVAAILLGAFLIS